MSEHLRTCSIVPYGFDAVVREVHPARGPTTHRATDGGLDVLAHQASALVAVTRIAETGQMVGPAGFDLGDDPIASWNDVSDGVIAALDRPGVLQQEGTCYFGKPTVDESIGFVAWDPLGRSWELAQATGQDAQADPAGARHRVDTIMPMADMLRTSVSRANPSVASPTP